MTRFRWLAMFLCVFVFTAACGGGDDGGTSESTSDETSQSAESEAAEGEEAADDEAESEPSEEENDGGTFECPVTVEDAEEAYAPLQLKEIPGSGGEDCTFAKEDETGSVVISVLSTDAKAAYAGILATSPDPEKLAGIGDEAAYSKGASRLVARVDAKVLVIQSISMIGVDDQTLRDTDKLTEAIQAAAVKLATKAASNL